MSGIKIDTFKGFQSIDDYATLQGTVDARRIELTAGILYALGPHRLDILAEKVFDYKSGIRIGPIRIRGLFGHSFKTQKKERQLRTIEDAIMADGRFEERVDNKGRTYAGLTDYAKSSVDFGLGDVLGNSINADVLRDITPIEKRKLNDIHGLNGTLAPRAAEFYGAKTVKQFLNLTPNMLKNYSEKGQSLNDDGVDMMVQYIRAAAIA